MSDITKYLNVALSNRKTAKTRSEEEAELDFITIVDLRKAGATFEEITDVLNQSRHYYTTVQANRALYNTRIRKAIIMQDSDEAAELERIRILEELDWIYAEATRKWQALKAVDYVEEISGYVDSGEDGSDDDDDEENGSKKGRKYSKKKIGLNEQHGAKYFDIMMKALEMRAKMVGVAGIQKSEISIVDLLKGRMLDDGGSASSTPLGSEDDVMIMYRDQVNPTLMKFEDAIPIDAEDYVPDDYEDIEDEPDATTAAE
jgi:hypothetical protein